MCAGPYHSRPQPAVLVERPTSSHALQRPGHHQPTLPDPQVTPSKFLDRERGTSDAFLATHQAGATTESGFTLDLLSNSYRGSVRNGASRKREMVAEREVMTKAKARRERDLQGPLPKPQRKREENLLAAVPESSIELLFLPNLRSHHDGTVAVLPSRIAQSDMIKTAIISRSTSFDPPQRTYPARISRHRFPRRRWGMSDKGCLYVSWRWPPQKTCWGSGPSSVPSLRSSALKRPPLCSSASYSLSSTRLDRLA